jgi:lycopene beta-cyclase
MKKIDIPSALVIILWVLTMIFTPIALWTWGQDALYRMINLGVLMQVAASLTVLTRTRGWQFALRLALPVLPLAWLAEYIGSATGFPFGGYDYTEVLQPQLLHVPLLIPLAWLMMLPPAWAVAAAILPSANRWQHAALAALAFTAWDLFLDPQMVAWNFWQWHEPGAYFGIPLVNYAGWLLISFVMTALIAPRNLPITPLLVIYAVTWILQTIGQVFFWNLPGPALFGFLGMGAMLAWAVWSVRRA